MKSVLLVDKTVLTINNAIPDDAEEIQNVFFKTWMATYPNNVPGVTVDDVNEYFKEKLSSSGIEKYKKRIEEELTLENQRFFVAKVDKKIVGLCLTFILEEINQLKAIYVLPEFQSKGIGHELWSEVFKFIDKTKDTTVDVVVYNESAIKFYEKLGFVDTGRRWIDDKFRMESGAIFPEMELKIKGDNSPKK